MAPLLECLDPFPGFSFSFEESGGDFGAVEAHVEIGEQLMGKVIDDHGIGQYAFLAIVGTQKFTHIAIDGRVFFRDGQELEFSPIGQRKGPLSDDLGFFDREHFARLDHQDYKVRRLKMDTGGGCLEYRSGLIHLLR